MCIAVRACPFAFQITVFGMMAMAGWKISILESICMIVVVGMAGGWVNESICMIVVVGMAGG